jgi:hypothetical protein
MYQNLHKQGLGGFAAEDYWSFTELRSPSIATESTGFTSLRSLR